MTPCCFSKEHGRQACDVPSGEDYTAYNVQRWGGDGWTAQLRRSGKPDGALFASWKTWPNTLHAHRLAEHAQRAGKGCQAQDKLFERIYELGGNVSDKSILLQVDICFFTARLLLLHVADLANICHVVFSYLIQCSCMCLSQFLCVDDMRDGH